MMDLEGFNFLVQTLRDRGLPENTAQQYAALIGDTPEVDVQGQWVIRDDAGKILAVIAPLWEQT